MHLSPAFVFLALTTLLTPSLAQSSATPTSTPTPSNTLSVNCLKFPTQIIGNATFDPLAITGLSNELADNTFNPPLPSDGIKLSPGSSSRVGFEGNGGYQVCLQNFYFFKTLTVRLSDVSDAVKQIGSSCCATTDNAPGQPGRRGKCQDAKVMVKSTDGSEVKVVGQDYGDRCCGMWGC